MSEQHKAVLITGCSSGIGRATALRLSQGDWIVYATARRLDSIEDLARAGCRTLQLDLTDEASMQRAVARIEADCGAVSALVNNAGYSQSGTIEETSIELIRRQFETNVFGLARLTQLVLPGMRRSRYGKIIHLGSMGGSLLSLAVDTITPRSTRWRPSVMRCDSRSRASASMSCSCSRVSFALSSRKRRLLAFPSSTATARISR